MPDIRLVQNADFPNAPAYSVTIDWSLLADGTLDDRDSLATAVIVALGTDRLADTSDILPDPDSTDRAGWWGDLDAQEIWGGWNIGSRLWLLKRDKIEPSQSSRGATVVRVEYYIREAIQPFIDNKIASSFDVAVARVDVDRIDAQIVIYRGPMKPIDLRYQILWTNIEMEGLPLQEFTT